MENVYITCHVPVAMKPVCVTLNIRTCYAINIPTHNYINSCSGQ